MKKSGWIILALALVVIVGGASLLYQRLADDLPGNSLAENETAAELVAAPDFQVLNQYGMKANLSDFEGKPVVLNFWASWCGPCKSEMPDFQDAYEEYGDQVHFVMVNLTDGYQGETREQAQAYVNDADYTFPVYFDTESVAAIAYGVNSVPRTYFIDAEGYVVAWAGGAIDREQIQVGLDMILP